MGAGGVVRLAEMLFTQHAAVSSYSVLDMSTDCVWLPPLPIELNFIYKGNAKVILLYLIGFTATDINNHKFFSHFGSAVSKE
jgi:hypothetical protein